MIRKYFYFWNKVIVPMKTIVLATAALFVFSPIFLEAQNKAGDFIRQGNESV